MDTPPFSKSYYSSQFVGFLGNSVWKFSTAAPLPPVILPHENFNQKPTHKTRDGHQDRAIALSSCCSYLELPVMWQGPKSSQF